MSRSLTRCGLPTRPRLVTLARSRFPSPLWLRIAHQAEIGYTPLTPLNIRVCVADCPPGRDWLHCRPGPCRGLATLRIAHQAEIGYTEAERYIISKWLRIAHQAEIGYTSACSKAVRRCCCGLPTRPRLVTLGPEPTGSGCCCGLPTRPRLVTLDKATITGDAIVADCPPGRDWLHSRPADRPA